MRYEAEAKVTKALSRRWTAAEKPCIKSHEVIETRTRTRGCRRTGWARRYGKDLGRQERRRFRSGLHAILRGDGEGRGSGLALDRRRDAGRLSAGADRRCLRPVDGPPLSVESF